MQHCQQLAAAAADDDDDVAAAATATKACNFLQLATIFSSVSIMCNGNPQFSCIFSKHCK